MAVVNMRKPLLSIQCDWDEVLCEKNGSAWVSCKEFGSGSKHGKLSVTPGDCQQIQATDGFKVEAVTKKSIIILHEDPNCKCTFFAPDRIFSSIHKKSIVGLNVNRSGLGLSVCSDNKLHIWDASNGSVLRNLEGHIYVYICRFFPSGIVVLSAGADMQIKIWSAETGKCAATFHGHTAAIVDAAIVERGRNIVTVSRDGTARLWDCGKSACLDVIVKERGTINCCALSSVDIDVGQPQVPISEREVGTEGKLLVLGCENGQFEGIGLQSRKSIFKMDVGSAVNCCCFISSEKAVFGTQSGKIYLFDTHNTSQPTMVWEESASAALCLIPAENGFCVGRADGTCSVFFIKRDMSVQLTGPDFDPVCCMASDGVSVFTGCRDGKIRKYTLPPSANVKFL